MYNILYNFILSFHLVYNNNNINLCGKDSKLQILDYNKVKFYSTLWESNNGNDNNIKNLNKLTNNPLHYYFAYYNSKDKLNSTPEFIGGLILDTRYKIFDLNSIIENPNNINSSLFYEYILELEELCYLCNVSLTIENLKYFSNSKYWYLINNYF